MIAPLRIESEDQVRERTIGPRSVHHLLGVPLVDGAWIQYGQANVGTVTAGGEATTAVTFTKPFNNTTYYVFLTTAQTTNEFRVFNRSNSKATTGFNIVSSNDGAVNATSVLVDWIAIGV